MHAVGATCKQLPGKEDTHAKTKLSRKTKPFSTAAIGIAINGNRKKQTDSTKSRYAKGITMKLTGRAKSGKTWKWNATNGAVPICARSDVVKS